MRFKSVKTILALFLCIAFTGCSFVFQTGRRSDVQKIEELSKKVDDLNQAQKILEDRLSQEIQDKHGISLKSFSPTPVQRVISEDTAARIKKILTGVVEEGTGKLGKISGFTAAGKTGTAQKLEPNGAYSHNKFVASFIGFAPTERLAPRRVLR
jgi:membrane peptidoglycan carboxypeptidase